MSNHKFDSKWRAVIRVLAGNFLEMYDFMVYAYYASYIAHEMFPGRAGKMGAYYPLARNEWIGLAGVNRELQRTDFYLRPRHSAARVWDRRDHRAYWDFRASIRLPSPCMPPRFSLVCAAKSTSSDCRRM